MAAGLGFKDFTTGEVLTAADVDGYLMQGVWVFANAAARTAAVTSPQEGNISFLKDTNSTEYYSGSAWVAIGGSVPTSLEFTAGKNKIINGDFGVNQRGFTSTTTSGTYGFDRWAIADNTTVTYSAQTFTPGAAPVAGYEGTNFARMAVTTDSTAGEFTIFQQKIEDVRTYAGQTVTFSFWAKASSGTPKVGVELWQTFGSGGSVSTGAAGQSVTISTSWTRYSVTIANPSVSGKTIGAGSFTEANLWCTAGSTFNTRSGSVGNQTATIDIWGVQLEAGSTATSFQTATGTLQGELAACQRYYNRIVDGTGKAFMNAHYYSSTQINAIKDFPVVMRTTPTLDAASGSSYYLFIKGTNDAFNSLTIASDVTNSTGSVFNNSEASGTAGYAGYLYTNNASAYVAFSAEL